MNDPFLTATRLWPEASLSISLIQSLSLSLDDTPLPPAPLWTLGLCRPTVKGGWLLSPMKAISAPMQNQRRPPHVFCYISLYHFFVVVLFTGDCFGH